MHGLLIDDAMVALVLAGELEEGRVQEFIGRTALFQMLARHGYDGTGGVRDLTAGIDSWRVETGRHGRVSTADLRAGVEDGRIAPKARVYQSDWAQMMATADLTERLRMATEIKDRLTGLHRYYGQRLARVNEVLDAIDAQRHTRLDLDSLRSDDG